ncbi:hypothetical protein DT23_10675 [Thioclava indica]|uniref:Endonuclease/exonuclease/phosphatase domain-containing protein n=1 Tax=Thioclava indica TaxID=1353528 RepID=A0A074JX10_9RHOB|nr:hypothetical protein DT23_10675 [Thioclava indica]
MLLRDISAGKDPQLKAVREILDHVDPDVLLLMGIDWDYDGRALAALNATLARPFPYLYAPQPNAGLPSGVDLDGNGALGEARDAQGYGRFLGQGGMAIVSRLPILTTDTHNFSTLLWRDLPETSVNNAQLSNEALAVQRLSSVGHWDVPVAMPDGQTLHLFAFAATPPVFDGPEDRNGWRNHDEAAFWLRYLDGDLAQAPPNAPFVLLGDFDIDPQDGEGRRAALRALLSDPRLQDASPQSDGGKLAADADHKGDPSQDTADFNGPGNLRVDYVLPSARLQVTGAGVMWPAPGAPLAKAAERASRHKLVWVDILAP